jgi:hypothetical protein
VCNYLAGIVSQQFLDVDCAEHLLIETLLCFLAVLAFLLARLDQFLLGDVNRLLLRRRL